VRKLAGRAYFQLCLALGRVMRSARYSTARLAREGDECLVLKVRSIYAPLLVGMADPLFTLLDAGVRVLPHGSWQDRERQMYRTFRRIPIRTNADGTLILPCLAGETLASLLEDPELTETARTRAIELAVVALAEFHRLGLTHGDAMAENVLIDLEAGVAHWIDFETMHDSRRPKAWRRADDLRALLVTCIVRTGPEKRAQALRLILDLYGDVEVERALAASFTSVFRRPLVFHLGQAPLSLESFREIHRVLGERGGG
jgi:hypothetical protein